jgi:hypothetical protein
VEAGESMLLLLLLLDGEELEEEVFGEAGGAVEL